MYLKIQKIIFLKYAKMKKKYWRIELILITRPHLTKQCSANLMIRSAKKERIKARTMILLLGDYLT